MTGQEIGRVDLVDDAGSIVLYDWAAEAAKDGRNLVRVDPMGNVVWRASPPTTGMQDCFVRMQRDGQALTANTWSGYRVSVDLQSGDGAVLEFTK